MNLPLQKEETEKKLYEICSLFIPARIVLTLQYSGDFCSLWMMVTRNAEWQEHWLKQSQPLIIFSFWSVFNSTFSWRDDEEMIVCNERRFVK